MHAAAHEIARGGNHHPVHVADSLRHHAGILEVADADREIDAFLDQIYGAVREPQLAADLGIAAEIVRHQRIDVETPEHQRRRHDQMSGGTGAIGARRRFRLFDLRQNPPRPGEVALPDIGQRHRARRPLQQPGADTFLKRRHHPCHGRGGDLELAGRRREALEVGNRNKGFHRFDTIHVTIA